MYTGKAILAQQQVTPSSSVVIWKHEDIVTGSYTNIVSNGQIGGGLTGGPPATAEFEPLGGAIPQTDPVITDELYIPKGLRTFRFASDLNQPEAGCVWDGTPIHCSHLGFILGGSQNWHINVNTRAEGGWDAYYALRASVSVWRYNKYLVVNNEDSRLTRAAYEQGGLLDQLDAGGYGGENRENYKILVGSWLEIHIAPIWDLVAPDDNHLASKAPDRRRLSFVDQTVLTAKIKKLLTQNCKKFIEELIATAKEITDDEFNNADPAMQKTMFMPPTEIYGDIDTVFNSVSKQGGFYGSEMSSTSTIGGRIRQGDATVYLAAFYSWKSLASMGLSMREVSRRYDYFMDRKALAAIHEMLHFSFHDVELAKAVAAMNHDKKSRFSYNNTDAASAYWNRELIRRCGNASMRAEFGLE